MEVINHSKIKPVATICVCFYHDINPPPTMFRVPHRPPSGVEETAKSFFFDDKGNKVEAAWDKDTYTSTHYEEKIKELRKEIIDKLASHSKNSTIWKAAIAADETSTKPVLKNNAGKTYFDKLVAINNAINPDSKPSAPQATLPPTPSDPQAIHPPGQPAVTPTTPPYADLQAFNTDLQTHIETLNARIEELEVENNNSKSIKRYKIIEHKNKK